MTLLLQVHILLRELVQHKQLVVLVGYPLMVLTNIVVVVAVVLGLLDREVVLIIHQLILLLQAITLSYRPTLFGQQALLILLQGAPLDGWIVQLVMLILLRRVQVLHGGEWVRVVMV